MTIPRLRRQVSLTSANGRAVVIGDRVTERVLTVNSVTIGLRISDTLYYGDGEWDKIPYSCDVTLSVELPKELTTINERLAVIPDAVEQTKELVYDAMQSHIEQTRDKIREQFSDKFGRRPAGRSK